LSVANSIATREFLLHGFWKPRGHYKSHIRQLIVQINSHSKAWSVCEKQLNKSEYCANSENPELGCSGALIYNVVQLIFHSTKSARIHDC
jgi:hypothetical protein